MRLTLQRIPSGILALYVAVIDTTIWLGALPFELYCKTIVTHGHPGTPALIGILLANALLLGLMLSAVAVTCELVRRGFTRPVPILLRVFRQQR
jgi:hypothetical protein